jgi:prefoldin subunit 5
MPAPIKITIQNKVYTTPILNGEMDNIAEQIHQQRATINILNSELTDAIATLNSLNKQFMSMYIQQTGSFPEN